MKFIQEGLLVLFSNLFILNTLAHEEKINFSNSPIVCKDNKDPIYILDETSLTRGHGSHNYITVCPEDLDHHQKQKRHEFMKKHDSQEHEPIPHRKTKFVEGQRHNLEYEKPDIKPEIFDWSEKGKLPLNFYNGDINFEEDDDDVYEDPLSAFKVEFYCSETPNICAKANNSFIRATQKIAISLKIKTQIVVQASLYSFCKVKGSKYCNNNSSIGSAAASAYHILNNNGTKYLYPQPLVKQMDGVGIYLATDITSDFNSDYSFYFSGDDTIEDGQIDFEYVVLHELIHGLGFATSFQKYFSLVAKVIDDQDFLTPGLSLINDTYVSNWRPTQIFDKHIISTEINTPINVFNQDVVQFTGSSKLLSPLEYHNEFIRSVGPYQAAKQILNFASNSPGSLVFRTSDGDDIVLYTKKNEFLQGTSIAHLSDSYKYTPDFIMISDVSPLQGRTLASMYKEYGKNNPYGALGPNVLKVLKEIGWQVADEPENIESFYANAIVSAATSNIKSFTQLFLCFILSSFSVLYFILF